MNITAAKKILTQKEPPKLYEVVEPALKDGELRDLLVEGAFNKHETLRYNSVRVLLRALGREPQLFYPYWDRFANMLASPNGFHRSVASQAIAYLSTVDIDCRLDGVLVPYLGLLDDSKVMVSHYFIENLDWIYRARPDLQQEILKTLLSIDQTNHPLERRELLKADILGVFDRLFDVLAAKDRKRAIVFAHAAFESKSGKTRKAAKTFLAAHAG